jgi:hypothetical protein
MDKESFFLKTIELPTCSANILDFQSFNKKEG